MYFIGQYFVENGALQHELMCFSQQKTFKCALKNVLYLGHVATTGLTAQKLWTRFTDKRHELGHAALKQACPFWTSGSDALLLARRQGFGPTMYAISAVTTISQ